MGGRYVITGTEIGILIGIPDQEGRENFAKKVMVEGYICENISKQDIIRIVKNARR